MATSTDGMTLYLYGDRNARLAAAMKQPEFRHFVQQICDQDEISSDTVDPSGLGEAIETGLVEVTGDRYRTGPRLVVVPGKAEESAATLMRPALAHYVEIAGEVAGELEAAYAESASAGSVPWDEVVHTLMAGMFLDLAMGMEVYRSGEIARRPVGDSVVWAFEQVSGRNAYGVQWFAAPHHRAFVAQLWHRTVQRPELRLSHGMVDLLVRAACGQEGDSAEEEAGSSKDALYLRYLGFLAGPGVEPVVRVPVFGVDETQRLLPILVEGARRLVGDAIRPALDGLGFDPWWRERIDKDPYRHAAVRLALEYGIDCVVGAKVIPAFPVGKCPTAWGRWVWAEPEVASSLIPSVATQSQEAVVG